MTENTIEDTATMSNHPTSTLRSTHESGMNSSIFRFKDVNFVAPSKDASGNKKDKFIVQDVSGTVKWGHVLAIMGPSGAGKVRENLSLKYGKRS
jgi:ABC-type glutathione transport system ATPase component